MKATPPKPKAEGPPKQKKSKRRMKAERRKFLRRVPDDEKEKSTTVDLPRDKDTEPASSRIEDHNDPSTANKIDEKRSSSIGGKPSTPDPEQDLIDLNDDTLDRLHLPPPDLHTTKFEAELKAAAVNHALSLQDSESPEAIGLVYLVDHSRQPGDCLAHKELNIGIILDPHHRGKGHARQVVELVLEEAFEKSACHRVQAILPDHVAKNRALCFFTQMRFAHEGTRRRGFYSAMENVYKDVTYMGILDTDWVIRQVNTGRDRLDSHINVSATYISQNSTRNRDPSESCRTFQRSLTPVDIKQPIKSTPYQIMSDS
ncbi:hypothetical protein H0H93_011983 [Arthromyces matolae]|nr:hypothetical protein H0H93_011983 [Arthromyces matolae]